MISDVFVFRLVGGLVYTGEVTGQNDDTSFLNDERVGNVELLKAHVVAKEIKVNKTVRRTDLYG